MHSGCGRRANGIPGLSRLAEVADLLGTTDRLPRLIAAAMAAMMYVVPLTWGFRVGAGEGNRTLMTLEDRWCRFWSGQGRCSGR
jgi:hypothetical protein